MTAISRWIDSRSSRLLGGPGRLRIVLLLAAVLALSSADTGTIGAAAAQLEGDLKLGHAQLGLLATIPAGVGAIASIPVGVLADRVVRVRVLTAVVALWGVTMIAGGFAPDYNWLLLTRLPLGAAVGASAPLVVSLTGDYFPAADRASVLGWILTGEIIGAGLGLVAGGEVAAALSWRYAFFLLAAASLALALALWRKLPEPARGGPSRQLGAYGPDQQPDDNQPDGGRPDGNQPDGGRPDGNQPDGNQPDGGRRQPVDQAVATVLGRGVQPAADRVLGAGQERMSLLRATHYLLRIPSNRSLILASALGYFFFAGLRTFGVIFAMQQFHVSQSRLGAFIPIIGIAALVGAVVGGRLADRALRRGHSTARIVVPAVGYTVAALLFLPGVGIGVVAVALSAITLGAGALAVANPPLDAARLDIVPARMWGRAESVRTVLRLIAEAIAPAAFGLVADQLAGSEGRNSGLQAAFLIMLVPLLANGLLLLGARRSYPTDVATAQASDRRWSG